MALDKYYKFPYNVHVDINIGQDDVYLQSNNFKQWCRKNK